METFHLDHLSEDAASHRFKLGGPSNLRHLRSPTLCAGDARQKMEEIRHYVHSTIELYEKVFDCLASEEAFSVQPIHKLRHPMIFYYGHTASFYINKLCVAGLTTRINPQFEEMFAVGVDEMSWDDLNEAHYAWPTATEVCQYRRLVRDRLDELMTSGKYPLNLPLTFDNSTKNDANSFWWVILMGAEHERIHVETASVHVRELPLQFVRGSMSKFWKRCEKAGRAPANELIAIPGGIVKVGRSRNSELYGWDCDYSDGMQSADVLPFKASKYLVSNTEFLDFVKGGGYETQRFWDEEGWNWVSWKQAKHPWFWIPDDSRPNGFALRLQTELIDLPCDWPCELNHLEAHAFCSYKSETLGTTIRMPTEEEWLLLFDRFIGHDQPQWGLSAPGNLNLELYASSCPVNENRHGELYDVVGNVWQHCETSVYPYQGFRLHPFYDDFSLPTFDGRHKCMKGGAWISTGNEATRDARFAFRRHFFQFIGLRYVEGSASAAVDHVTAGGFDPAVDMITDTCFRPTYRDLSNGCLKIAEFAKRSFSQYAHIPASRAMDIACGAGRVSYELTSSFDEVIGVDYSARLLIPAFALREKGSCQYRCVDTSATKTVQSRDYAWGATREKATFFQADPTNLHAHLDSFALIVCWNCLERSYRPSFIPPHLLARLRPGGLLIIGGDFCWDNIKSDSSDTETANNTYTADPLVQSQDPHNAVYELLGGSTKVDRVGEAVTIPVAFHAENMKTTIRSIELRVYVKK